MPAQQADHLLRGASRRPATPWRRAGLDEAKLARAVVEGADEGREGRRWVRRRSHGEAEVLHARRRPARDRGGGERAVRADGGRPAGHRLRKAEVVVEQHGGLGACHRAEGGTEEIAEACETCRPQRDSAGQYCPRQCLAEGGPPRPGAQHALHTRPQPRESLGGRRCLGPRAPQLPDGVANHPRLQKPPELGLHPARRRHRPQPQPLRHPRVPLRPLRTHARA